MQADIKKAMHDLKLLQFTYRGQQRVAEPHALNMRDGRVQMLGYQIRGASISGGVPIWREFEVDEMQILEVLEERFAGPRTNTPVQTHAWIRKISSLIEANTTPSHAGALT